MPERIKHLNRTQSTFGPSLFRQESAPGQGRADGAAGGAAEGDDPIAATRLSAEQGLQHAGREGGVAPTLTSDRDAGVGEGWCCSTFAATPISI